MRTIRMLFCFAVFTMLQLSYAQTKAFLKVEAGGHTALITKLFVTSDQKYLVSAAGDKTIRIWDTESKKEIRKILGQIGEGPQGMIHAIALSREDKYLAASVHMAETYNNNARDDSRDRIRLYDFKSGKLLKIIDPKNTDDLMSLDFSDDLRYLVSGSEDHSIKVWDLENVLKTDPPAPYHTIRSGAGASFQRVYAMEIFKYEDDYRIVFADYSEFMRKVLLYSLKDKKFLNSYQDRDRLDHLAISDKYIAASGYSEHILIFDLNLNHLKTLPYSSQPKGMAFSPDGSLLLAGGIADMDTKYPLNCTVFDVNADFKKIATFSKHDARVEAVAFLDNQTAITAGGSRKDIYFWDARSADVKGKILGGGNTVFSVGLDADYIGFGNTQDYKMDQNNYAPLERAFNLKEFSVSDLSSQDVPSYTRAAATWKNQKLYVQPHAPWDLIIRKEQYDYPVWRPGGWYYHEAYGFTDDGLVISGSRGGGVFAYSNNGRRMLAEFIGHTNKVWDLAVQGNWLVTASVDQTIKVWNLAELKSGKRVIYPMLNLFISNEGEWIVWSKSGYYDASLNGDKYIGYHVNQGEDQEALFYASDRFLKTLYRPDIIRYILDTGSEEEALERAALEGTKIENLLPPRITLLSDAHITTDEAAITVDFEVTPEHDAVTRIWGLRNDHFVWSKRGQEVASGGRFSQTIPLMPGKNQIKIFAESRVAKSNPISITADVDDSGWATRGRSTESDFAGQKKMKEEKPNLYVLAIGVSEYENAGPGLKNLHFAHKDATQVMAAFRAQKGKIYNDVIVKLLVNETATKAKIENAIVELKAEVWKREAYKEKNNIISRDVTLLFMAGHGVKQGEDFYFLNYDANLQNLEKTGLRIMDIGKTVTSFPTELIIMTDACRSGMVGGDIVKNIDVRELTKRLTAINERAQVILNATTAKEPSVENKEFGHGVFTKVMLDGLQEDDEVTILQLVAFIPINVKRLTRNAPTGVQKPTVTIYGNLDDYEIHRK